MSRVILRLAIMCNGPIKGVDQFKTPRQIIGFHDKDHAKVTGTKTGVPVRELSKWEQSAQQNTGSSSQQTV